MPRSLQVRLAGQSLLQIEKIIQAPLDSVHRVSCDGALPLGKPVARGFIDLVALDIRGISLTALPRGDLDVVAQAVVRHRDQEADDEVRPLISMRRLLPLTSFEVIEGL